MGFWLKKVSKISCCYPFMLCLNPFNLYIHWYPVYRYICRIYVFYTTIYESLFFGCTDKTSQDKTSSDIRSQGQNVPRTKCPKDKTSQGTKRPKRQNVPRTKRPKGQNVPRKKKYTLISNFSKTDFIWIFLKMGHIQYVRYYYFGQVRLGHSLD